MTHRGDRALQTAGLARVEGEGGMYVRVDDGQVIEVRLDIYEPPRFFEAFLRGRLRDRGDAPADRRVPAAGPAVRRDRAAGRHRARVSEAPRGVLYHAYELDADGMIADARIVPPTSQNQAAIQADLRDFVQARLDLDDERLTHDYEQAIRNYDPCISCAAHFLTLWLDRT